MEIKDIDLARMQKLVEKAEQIISIIKDPQLKSVAFGRVLDFLLHGRESGGKEATEYVDRVRKIKKVERTKKSDGPKTWMEELIEEGFFEKPKTVKELLSALEERDHHLKNSDMQPYLRIFMKEKRLRRKKQASKEGGKPVWHYSNW